MTWQRLEAMCRSESLSPGLEARVADPLWMLARQWQVGELRGDDAARPVAVTMSTRSLPLATMSKGSDEARTVLPTSVPLEYLVEQVGEPTAGEAGLYSAARMGHRLLRLLAGVGLDAARLPLTAEFSLATSESPLATTGLMAETAAMLAKRSLDGRQVLAATVDQLRGVLDKALDDHQMDLALAAIESWRAWCASRGAAVTEDAWDDERLEYAFSVTAPNGAQNLVFEASEHTGGDIDWFSFDLSVEQRVGGTLPPPRPDTTGNGRAPTVGDVKTLTSMPSPVQFRGQPAQRWWEFEDRSTNFADIDAGPADLARLLVTEFAVAFSNDWFVVPARVDVGTANEVTSMTVVDNFGAENPIVSTAAHDAGPMFMGARPWRLFELGDDQLSNAHRSPWLLVAPTAVGDLTGAALERVNLVRDEGANLVWAIEKLVEGPAGRSLDRAMLAPRPVLAPTPDADSTPVPALSLENQVWKYRLESQVPPPFWIPFLPERISDNSAQVRLRRARMQQWETSDVTAPGPHGVVLDGTRPCWIREEEVPRSGIRVDRRWRYARGHDGVGHVWLQLEKSPGSGERSSGVRWDVLEVGVPTT